MNRTWKQVESGHSMKVRLEQNSTQVSVGLHHVMARQLLKSGVLAVQLLVCAAVVVVYQETLALTLRRLSAFNLVQEYLAQTVSLVVTLMLCVTVAALNQLVFAG
jgi:hypothetical protein